MSRPDLLALTPESVATLTNLGLVKRAQREIAAGQGPTLAELEGGLVTGTFADGVVASLPPGVSLRQASCTCDAVTVCRHRVAVALAYAEWHARTHGRDSAPAIALDANRNESPGSIEDEALEQALGRRTLEKARQLRQRGCDVEIRRAGEGRPVSEARLPTCSVQFLVPRDLAYARCECAVGQGCEHVAIAVWAFRAADARALGPTATVHVAADEPDSVPLESLRSAVGLCREVLVEGVVNLAPSFDGNVARARADLEKAGLTWPATVVDDIEEQVEAYRTRSARYSAGAAARLVAEMAARARAAAGGGELPPGTILGLGESRETPLSHARFVSLGARVAGTDRERSAEVYLADPTTGVVVTLRKTWTYGEAETPDDGPRLGERSVVPGVRLRELARGQVVTHSARRLANRLLKLGASRKGSLSVTPQAGDWSDFPAGIVIADMEAHLASLQARPPQPLRPRLLAESLHLIRVKEVQGVRYLPGQQALVAGVVEASGYELLVRRRHRSAAPKALESLAQALDGSSGPVQYLSGNIFAIGGHLEMDPVVVAADRLVVLDIEDAEMPGDVMAAAEAVVENPLRLTVQDAWTCLEQAAHIGLRATTAAWIERLRGAADKLGDVGLAGSAACCRALADAARAMQEARSASEPASRAARAWEDAAVRLSLTQELLAHRPG